MSHARIVVLCSFLAGGMASTVGISVVSHMTGQVGAPHSESARAVAAIQHASGETVGTQAIVLLTTLDSPWPSTSAQLAVTSVSEKLQKITGIATVSTPSGATSPLVSTDHRLAAITASLRSNANSDDVARAVRTAFSGQHSVRVGGSSLAGLEYGERVASDLGRAELFAFPLLLILAIWIFRGLIAALVPMLVGGLTIIVTMAELRGVIVFTSLSQYVMNLVIGLGLGLSIDYCLFIISRYREEIARSGLVTVAIGQAVRACRTVLFSACTVGIAMSTLMLFPQKFLFSMGVGGVLVTLTAALAAVLTVPAMLVVLGSSIDSIALKRWHQHPSEHGSSEVEATRWYRLSRWVMMHAGRILVLGLALAALLITPAFSTRFSNVDIASLPLSSTTREVSDTLATEFSTLSGSSLYVDVSAGQQNEAAVTELAHRIGAVAHVNVEPPRYLGRNTWCINASIAAGPYSSIAATAVDQVRGIASPVHYLVGGDAADFSDLKSSLIHRLPWALGLAGLAVLVIIFLMTGSLVLAIKTLVLNVVNVAMTYGILVWVFQYGHLEGLLNFSSTGSIDLTQPILVAIIAFGLSTDYGVFLFARIKEAHDNGLDDVHAVSTGVGRSGRIITSAALLMAIAVGAFSSSSVLFIKELGLGSASAVILDATLIRAFLVPATMRLLGRANWWSPKALQRFGNHAWFAE